MTELVSPQSKDWMGMNVQIRRVNGIDLVTFNGEGIQRETERIVSRARAALGRISGLTLFDPQTETDPFVLKLAVLDRPDFEKLLFEGKANPQAWAWARACVRTMDKFADTVVYDASIADDSWESDLNIAKDEFRELHHEIVHPMVNNSLPHSEREESTRKQTGFHEIVAELVPRVLLGFQHRDRISSNFLLNLSEADILPLSEVNKQSYSCFSGTPLRTNPVYGGVFLTGLSGVHRLGGGDFLEGTRKLVRTAQRCIDSDNLWQELGSENFDPDWFLTTKEPFQEGQELLREFVHK